MKPLTPLERQVLDRIKPRPEEYVFVEEKYREIKRILEEALRAKGVPGEVTLQGSFAKDTWLSREYDLDIFILLPETWTRDRIEREVIPVILEAAGKIGVPELRYAEHPYVRLRTDSVEADLVPAVKITDPSKLKTSVDRTPYHTRYVNMRLSREQRDHVRLLKKYMKGIGVYGADMKNRGFSGYIAELLIIRYGGFREVLEAASRWRPPVYIDIEGHSAVKLRRRYPDSVIYLPDPVDPRRNAAAAVSMKKLSIFILASACYLGRPCIEYYEPPPPPPPRLEGRCIVVLVFRLREKLPPDTVYGELARIARRATGFLEKQGFKAIDAGIWSDEEKWAAAALELEACTLPLYRDYQGPPAWIRERSINFLQKHLERAEAGPWIDEDGLLHSLDPRKHRTIHEFLDKYRSQYLVTPHLGKWLEDITGAREAAERLGEGFHRWLAGFTHKRPAWMECCIH